MNTKTKPNRTQPRPERDARLYQYHIAHPDASIAAIGRIYKISREWARQIIKREKEKEVSHDKDRRVNG